ncbi:hypothetical protein [Flavobacterium degerlachei]|jgi:hypothetical protein|uniref:Uncharacterized protein n=1 Tax=Flavobacterium degerlachei TaxID=229203 RepID=A0A1H2X7W4_9FLAO|nr:hypothetical protein [Flavobacterium degerlachei]SDW88554.1 hypothetical protein SAMN05444338_105164 [Flavobacterium degerlachei]
MKKFTLGILIIFVLTIGIYFIWWKLPLTINRSSDIKLGEKIIKNIENYKTTNELPDNDDWKTLRGFGFRDKIDFLQPEYRRVDKETFELIYIEGFDGPYLMWNSIERKWKEGYPTFPKTTEKQQKSDI